MSNQTNVYLVDARMLYERDAREVDLREPSNLIKPPAYVPLLQWIGRELERIGNSDDHHDALHEIEGLLLFDGGGGFGSPGIDFATQFERSWALSEDLSTLASFAGASLRRRLTTEDLIDSAGFPQRLDASSPLRPLDFPGWQFFDRSEVASMLGAVPEALGQKRELLYEEEWEELATAWRKKSYDFALFWWLI